MYPGHNSDEWYCGKGWEMSMGPNTNEQKVVTIVHKLHNNPGEVGDRGGRCLWDQTPINERCLIWYRK